MARFLVKTGSGTRESDADRIDLGTRSTTFAALDDPIASGRHAWLEWRDGGFWLVDAGSASGTWCNGREVRAPLRLADGDEIVLGAARGTVEIAGAGDRLLLTWKERGFFLEPSGKRKDANGRWVVGGDAELWVRDELRFTAFRPLGWMNLVAGVLGVLALVVLLLPAARERATPPGALHASHARLFDGAPPGDASEALLASFRVAREQGCDACHTSFGGAPAEKCAQCHAAIVTGHHPAPRGANAGAAARELAAGFGCSDCHRDHEGGAPDFVPELRADKQDCRSCHVDALPKPPAPSNVAVPTTTVALGYDTFGHATHTGIACALCHGRSPVQDASSLSEREFERVRFETCMRCHSADEDAGTGARWPRDPALAEWSAKVKPEHRVRVAWHGTEDDGRRCFACHARASAKELRTSTLAERAPLAFDVIRWDHAEEFDDHASVVGSDGKPRECRDCHADGRPLFAGTRTEGVFDHRVHLSGASANAECRQCHVDVLDAPHLAGAAQADPYAGPGPVLGRAESGEACARCHGRGGSLGLDPKPVRLANATRTRNDFPHDVHVRAATAGARELTADCGACHTFDPRSKDPAPATLAKAKDCTECHAGHANVGGGGCALCHATVDGRTDLVYSGGKRPVSRADNRGFSHFSRGHASTTQGQSCDRCHRGTETARSIADLAFPSEFEADCWGCHVETGRRFHWRFPPESAPR